MSTETSEPILATLDADTVADMATLAEWAAEHSGVDILGMADERAYIIGRHATNVVQVVDTDKFQSTPRRTVCTPAFTTLASLGEYLLQFETADRSVYVSETIEAVINDDRDNRPGWRDHRATYRLRQHPLFQLFTGSVNKPLSQGVFAELVEDLERCWISPDPATMLEIAQNVHAAGEKKLSSAVTLANGSIGLSYTSNDVITAGRAGDLTVPSRLKLELPVFDGTDLTHEVQVRLRTRRREGAIEFLLRPDESVEQVVQKALQAVGEALGALLPASIPVLFGKP